MGDAGRTALSFECRRDGYVEPLFSRQFDALGMDVMFARCLAHEPVGKESVIEENFINDEVDC
jgi:hypothetical protein